ncbi:hypothetical protein Q4534_22370 [Cyclobacterium sp. 1_MG-2023]|uniref:hypothetical protein n=1 Tax=Cyclobacterium sp. 1_MG-2023 TaxID=3062681 RepID=UPI0026E1841B|nr:hypothetical protein [Cyclobacterium sp. 1_MG-2023]MDO6440190.1 hypothetical protein [Cyclobacterium sp. 1_MG-2023]
MGKNTSLKQSFLILTNKTSLPLIQKYHKLFTATQNMGDTVVLYHLIGDNSYPNLEDVNTHIFDDQVLNSLNYFPLSFTLVPVSNHSLYYQITTSPYHPITRSPHHHLTPPRRS